jgi:hypothetical protein
LWKWIVWTIEQDKKYVPMTVPNTKPKKPLDIKYLLTGCPHVSNINYLFFIALILRCY